MVKDIINEISTYFKKRVVFNTIFWPVGLNEKTKSYKFEEYVEGEDIYLTTLRVNEYDDYVEVVKIDITSMNNAEFLKLNERKNNDIKRSKL